MERRKTHVIFFFSHSPISKRSEDKICFYPGTLLKFLTYASTGIERIPVLFRSFGI